MSVVVGLVLNIFQEGEVLKELVTSMTKMSGMNKEMDKESKRDIILLLADKNEFTGAYLLEDTISYSGEPGAYESFKEILVVIMAVTLIVILILTLVSNVASATVTASSPASMIDSVAKLNQVLAIKYEDLEFGDELECGQVGSVYKTTWIEEAVAVDRLNNDIHGITKEMCPDDTDEDSKEKWHVYYYS